MSKELEGVACTECESCANWQNTRSKCGNSECEYSPMAVSAESLRDIEVAWLSDAMSGSIANLGYPVGMGIPPTPDHARKCAETLFERFVGLSDQLSAGLKTYAATIAAERDELFAALQHPSYAEENKLRAERDALAKERDVLLIAHRAHEDTILASVAKIKELAKELAEANETIEEEREARKAKSDPVALTTPETLDALTRGHLGTLFPAVSVYASLVKLYTHPAPADKDGIPEGWMLVPMAPTIEMIDAGDFREAGNGPELVVAIWSAMLAAIAKEGKP